MRNYVNIILIIVINYSFASDQVPVPEQKHPILLKNCTIHPVSGEDIRGGSILFEKGIITGVGRRIANLPENTEIIDLKGKHVYPGPDRNNLYHLSMSAHKCYTSIRGHHSK